MIKHKVAHRILKVIQIVISNLHVHGKENIPTTGPYLVVLNHQSMADTPMLFLSFPLMKWRFFAGEKWENHWLYGPIMGNLGAIYINRNNLDRKALKEALQAVKEGAVFGLAPEGTRSKIGQMKEAKNGAAYLASRANVPIVPVGLENMDVLQPNVKRFRRTNVHIHIGKPFLLPELGHRPKGDELTALTHYIMCHVAALLPNKYHGIYTGSPAITAIQAEQDGWQPSLQYTKETVALLNDSL